MQVRLLSPSWVAIIRRHAYPVTCGVLFAPLLVAWTWKLLEPYPLPETVEAAFSFSGTARFIAAKTLHASVYSALAWLVTVGAPTRRWWFAGLGLLVAHAAGTEIAQHLMAVGRTGKVTDVLIDLAGISLGVLVAQVLSAERIGRWLTRPARA